MSDYNNEPYRAPTEGSGQPRHRRSERHRAAPAAPDSRAAGDTNAYQPQRPAVQEPEIQWARRQPAMPTQEGDGTAPYRYPQNADAVYKPRAVSPAEDEDEYDEERPFPWLKIALVGLAVLALLAVALMAVLKIGPFKGDGQPAKTPSNPVQTQLLPTDTEGRGPAEAYSFQAVGREGTTDSGLAFRLVSSQAVDSVEVWDEENNPLVSSATVSLDSEGHKVWIIDVVFDEPYEGRVFAVILAEDELIRTDLSDLVQVTLPVAEPTETPLATQRPVVTPTPQGQNNAVVTAAPTADATAAPVVTWAPTNAPLPTEAPTEAPTETPTDAPERPEETATPSPTSVPTPVPTQAPTALPTQTPLPKLEASAGDGSLKVTDTVFQGGKSLTFTRANSYQAPHPDLYSRHDIGVFTFRGDNFRRNAAFGTVDVQKEQLSVLWKTPIGSLRTGSGTFYGVGWTGQPAIVKWTIDIRQMMNLYDEKKDTSALREVIFGAQDGKIYFLDLRDGSATRDPINVGYPLKGSVSVHSLGMPLIAVGQGISKMTDNKQHPIGLHMYYLTDGKEAYFLNGRQSNSQKQYITNGAFDGTALFLYNDATRGALGDAMIVAGENGLLYTVDLDTQWSFPTEENPDAETSFSIKPVVTYLRTKANSEKEASVGVEGSVAMYDKYIYMADAYGIIRCVDSDTMKTVWAVDGGDNIDAALALDMDGDSGVSLYTGNTAYSRLGNKQDVTIRRLNALTGEEIWRYGIKCEKNNDQLSGCKASPVIGEHGISDLVIFTVNMVQGGGSKIVALEKATGQVRWERALSATAISSPIAVYNDQGDAWIIQADEGGTLTMLSGKTGSVRSTLDLGGTIQGSPAAYKNYLVIGTCDKDNACMYGIRIE